MDLLIHIVPQLAREFACPLPTTGNVPDRSSVVVAAAGEEDNYDNDQAVYSVAFSGRKATNSKNWLKE